MQRRTKQTLISLLYILIIISFFALIFFTFFFERASCVDHKKNQDETGIDCGGRCSEYCLADLAARPLVTTEVETLPYTNSSSDAIGKVSNKNTKAALKSATYTFRLYDQSGTLLGEQKGKFSLLPSETRTLAALGLEVAKSKVARTELVVSNEEWVAFTDFTEPPNIMVTNQQFSLLSGSAGFAEAKGLLQNRSPYDIRMLTIIVVPRDAEGNALSVNKTTMNTLQSGEQRDFRLVWPQSFAGTPTNVDMQVHFDMLAEDAFVQQYFPGGQFQSLSPGQ